MTSTHRALAARVTAQTLWASPLGPMLLACTDHGLAGAWFVGQKAFPAVLVAPDGADHPLLQQTMAELTAYFAGSRRSFEMPLDLHGTPFQQAVWQALCGIHAGALRSYSDVALQVGMPQAVRAVGAAVGRNPVSVIVPCHRVVGRNGSLTGYAGGLARKRALLELEGARTDATERLL